MTLRMCLTFCVTMLTACSGSADLIFSLGPVRFGSPTDGGPATGSPAFIDLLVESTGSDEFLNFGYVINIAPVDPMSAPQGGLFFSTPNFNEPADGNYVFFNNSTALAPLRANSNQSLQGADFTLDGNNVSLDVADGQRLVLRAELGIQSGLADGLEYLISIAADDFFAGRGTSSGEVDVPFSAMDSITFTTGSSTAAVPEPSSVAVLFVLVGGIMYRRRKMQM